MTIKSTMGFAMAVLLMSGGDAASTSAHEQAFAAFKKQFNKSYKADEEPMRRAAFEANMAKAELLRHANPLATFGLSPFADRSSSEFKVMHNAAEHYAAVRAKRSPQPVSAELKAAAAGQSIDWRKRGAVTPVKNQGQCGSCWSFSSTGNIEGQWFLAGNPLVALSEQELVSCDNTDNGCNGGLMDNAFTWLVENKGGMITSEAAYPYVSGWGQVPQCDMTNKPAAAVISGHHDVEHNEDAMAAYVYANGPLSIGVDASTWQTYTSGIMTNCASNQVDHGVLIVGFDDTHNPPYWIIKNSWTASWGEEGYIRVAKGSNQCLITTAPSSSIVQKGATVAPAGPPVPTSPPQPTPPPPQTFTQKVCGFMCLFGCQSHTLPTDTCLRTPSGSAKASCGKMLDLKVYQSQDCTGPAQEAQQPLNTCLKDTSGSYVENTCGSSSSATAMKQGAKLHVV